MMKMKEEKLEYFQNDDFQMVQLEYSSSNLATCIVLPTGNNIDTFISDILDINIISNAARKFKKETVDLSLPRFNIESSLKLNNTMKALGVNKAFAGGDFTNMTCEGGLSIGSVIHKAFLSVNENGTEAGVINYGEMFFCLPKIYKVNCIKPFLFLIYNKNDYNNLLYIAKIEQVNSI